MALERGKALKLADLNSGFTRPTRSRSRTSKRRCSSITSSRTYGEAKLQALVRSYGRGWKGTRRSRRRSASRIAESAGIVRQGARRAVRCASGPRCARIPGARPQPGERGGVVRRAGHHGAARGRGGASRQLRARSSRYGQALAAAGDRAAFEPLEKAAALVPVATGEDSPHAVMARLAEQLGDTARAMPSTARCSRRITRPSRRRGGSPRSREKAPATAARCSAYERVVAIDPFDPRRIPASAGSRCKNKQAGDRHARVQGGARDRAGRQSVGALRSRRSVPAGATGRRTRRPKRSRRSRSRRASIARRSCCCSSIKRSRRRRGPPMKRLAPGQRPSLGLLLWARASLLRRRGGRAERPRRPIRVSPACSGRSRASATTPGRVPRGGYLNPEDEPWFIDAPAAEQNLSRRVRTATAIQVNDPVVLTLEDPNSGPIPWIYIVEPGNLRLKDAEVPILREFLLRGGTLTFDDFHGPIEWANLESELRRVFPDRKIIDLPPAHPIFHCFYQFDSFPADARARLVPAGTHVGEGRLRRPPARDRGRQRPRDGAHQLERGHGRRLGVVERVRVPGYVKYTAHGLPDGDQRNHLFADPLMHTTSTDIAAVAERVSQGGSGSSRKSQGDTTRTAGEGRYSELFPRGYARDVECAQGIWSSEFQAFWNTQVRFCSQNLDELWNNEDAAMLIKAISWRRQSAISIRQSDHFALR